VQWRTDMSMRNTKNESVLLVLESFHSDQITYLASPQMNKLSILFVSCIATAMSAIGGPAQPTVLTIQTESPHPWYWLGHWQLWYGGWAYWWVVPLLAVLIGVVMFYLGRRSVI
jgi:hypothetical protein